jgi:hypothetical protein
MKELISENTLIVKFKVFIEFIKKIL